MSVDNNESLGTRRGRGQPAASHAAAGSERPQELRSARALGQRGPVAGRLGNGRTESKDGEGDSVNASSEAMVVCRSLFMLGARTVERHNGNGRGPISRGRPMMLSSLRSQIAKLNRSKQPVSPSSSTSSRPH